MAWFFNNHACYKKSEIDHLISSPLGEEVAWKLVALDNEAYAYIFSENNDYVFEYEYREFKFRLEANGSVYLNGELLCQDKKTVSDFLGKYARKGIFSTTAQTLFFRNYLKNREMWDLHSHDHNPLTYITLKLDGKIIFSERFRLEISRMDFPEAKAVSEMWLELRELEGNRTAHWGLIM